MHPSRRQEAILCLIEDRGYASVKELSDACGVSEMTIRRDLQRLHDEHRVRRTYGGAYALQASQPMNGSDTQRDGPPLALDGFLGGRVDVLITTPVDPRFDRILLDSAQRSRIPVIAESLSMGRATETIVAVDNYQAAAELGRWAGHHILQHLRGHARLLDLTFHLSNTLARSQGFLAGLRSIVPDAELVLSIRTLSDAHSARQLTLDALDVHPEINVIFAINDAVALGAIQACQERGVDPDSLLLITFGLEGETMRRALAEGGYCKAGLAMFPELVAPVCVEAAIAAFNRLPLPAHLVTPHAVLTPANFGDYYAGPDEGCRLREGDLRERLLAPFPVLTPATESARRVPRRIGFMVPFMEHEWYRNLIDCMNDYAGRLGIELEAVDAANTVRDDMVLRQRRIAQAAAELVHPGDVLLIDGSPINTCLAEELAHRRNITVITNSLPVFDVLRNCPGITLISTGGLALPSSETLTGPTAEAALRELRADKLFLAVTGISLDFGLSYSNLGEVAVKQAMIRAAREVILLADHSKFEQESVGQVAPATVVDKLITDNALPASTRLDLIKVGIEVITARM